jgi:hypothetical protein
MSIHEPLLHEGRSTLPIWGGVRISYRPAAEARAGDQRQQENPPRQKLQQRQGEESEEPETVRQIWTMMKDRGEVEEDDNRHDKDSESLQQGCEKRNYASTADYSELQQNIDAQENR